MACICVGWDIGSCIREETLEEIFSRITYGRFGACANINGDAQRCYRFGAKNNGQGFGSGTASGDGNYSPNWMILHSFDHCCPA